MNFSKNDFNFCFYSILFFMLRQHSNIYQIVFYTLLCLFCFSDVNAQNIDSLLKVENKIIDPIEKYDHHLAVALAYLNTGELSKGDEYLHKALEVAKSLEDANRIAKIFRYFGLVLGANGEYIAADSVFAIGLSYKPGKKVAVKLLASQLDMSLRMGTDNNEGLLEEIRTIIGDDTTSAEMGLYYLEYSNVYSKKRDLLNQLKYLQKAKKIAEVHPENIQTINRNLGVVYEQLKDFEKAAKIHTEQLIMAQEQNDPLRELFARFGVISTQYEVGDYDLARQTGFEAIELKKREGVSSAFGYIYFIMGLSHLEEEQFDSAAYYLNLGIDISLAQNEAKELGDNYAGMAKLMFKQGNLEEAKSMVRKPMLSLSISIQKIIPS